MSKGQRLYRTASSTPIVEGLQERRYSLDNGHWQLLLVLVLVISQ